VTEIVIVDPNEQVELRRQKLAELREQGQPFPNDFRIDAFAKTLLEKFSEKSLEILEQEATAVSVAGRLMTRRLMGKASFVHLQDTTGRIQLYIQQEMVGHEAYEAFQNWDLGDILGVVGVLFKTKTGELSIKVKSCRLLTKSLRPLPDKWHGLQDQEVRYRQRYLDLIVNEASRQVFRVRSKTIQVIREFLTERHFLEVETPMMQVLPGGAAAKPFVTHHNALDMDLYLRVSPELYLKRLVVGGFERVFEINRNFRNEGLSTRHNPEFTMIEFYQAYADYHDLMNLTEELFKEVVQKTNQSLKITYQGVELDFEKPFERLTIEEAILKHNPALTVEDVREKNRIVACLKPLGYEAESGDTVGKLQLELFERTAEAKLIQPTFITQYPIEVSPLARCSDHNPLLTDRAELFIVGREIANLFSELNDSEDQAKRFSEQVLAKAGGDEEAMHYDADYVTALEYGLPPTAGEGIGIDRLVMLLTDSPSIRDVLLFPHMRTQS